MVEFIGYLAAACTTISFIPQFILVLRTRDTHSISLSMYVIFTIGIISWLIYGICLRNWPMILANGLTLISAVGILSIKLQNYKTDHPKKASNEK